MCQLESDAAASIGLPLALLEKEWTKVPSPRFTKAPIHMGPFPTLDTTIPGGIDPNASPPVGSYHPEREIQTSRFLKEGTRIESNLPRFPPIRAIQTESEETLIPDSDFERPRGSFVDFDRQTGRTNSPSFPDRLITGSFTSRLNHPKRFPGPGTFRMEQSLSDSSSRKRLFQQIRTEAKAMADTTHKSKTVSLRQVMFGEETFIITSAGSTYYPNYMHEARLKLWLVGEPLRISRSQNIFYPWRLSQAAGFNRWLSVDCKKLGTVHLPGEDNSEQEETAPPLAHQGLSNSANKAQQPYRFRKKQPEPHYLEV